MFTNFAGCADSDLKKREAMRRLFNAWLRKPGLRIGQLLINAHCNEYTGGRLFYIEDFALVDAVEQFADREESP